jgi:type II secretory pathway pseudopilin PulG
MKDYKDNKVFKAIPNIYLLLVISILAFIVACLVYSFTNDINFINVLSSEVYTTWAYLNAALGIVLLGLFIRFDLLKIDNFRKLYKK